MLGDLAGRHAVRSAEAIRGCVMKQQVEQRAVAAVKGLAVARAEVERLTKAIGEALAKCPGVNGGFMLALPDEFGSTWQKDPNDITHLKSVYAPEKSESQYRQLDYLDDDEVVYRLTEECPHCLLAHQLVKQRRVARKRLGRAKATVTNLGRELMKKEGA